MLSLTDCLDFCDLTDGEVVAIATHENVPKIVALQMGVNLLKSHDGIETVDRFIREDLAEAERHGNHAEVAYWHGVLTRFRSAHP
jgi:hypothetical protein